MFLKVNFSIVTKIQKAHFLKERLLVNKNSSLYLPSLRGNTGTTADVVELVDMLDLGSSAARRAGSIPVIRTLKKKDYSLRVVLFLLL
tara:strand:- start:249 stop:512 length:264 start_codon:yes stop_codon:yes gene_type:complete